MGKLEYGRTEFPKMFLDTKYASYIIQFSFDSLVNLVFSRLIIYIFQVYHSLRNNGEVLCRPTTNKNLAFSLWIMK